jgi:ATP adenylyltransferase
MRVLWTPWRMSYIEKLSSSSKECVFCKVIKERDDASNLVLYRSTYSFIILNRYPYNTGHLMIVPYKHTPTPLNLTPDEMKDMFSLLNMSIKALSEEYGPDGFNIGANIGRVAGAGIEEHFHLHVVPRWCGDTNFLPIITETKTLPESLDNTYKRLRKRLDTITR